MRRASKGSHVGKLARRRMRIRPNGARRGADIDSDVVRGSGREEEWSLTSHSPGQELWIFRLEASILLGQAAGDDDGLAGELALVAG
jgi:hypothetical protein